MMRHIKYPSLVLLAAVGVFSAAAIVFLLAHRDRPSTASPSELPLTAETEALMRLGGEVLGAFVAGEFPGETVTLVTSPTAAGSRLPDPERAMLDGFLRTTERICDVRMAPLSPTAESAGALWQPGPVYDEAFRGAADSAAIVCLAGLPDRLSTMRFWWQDTRPPVIIANAPVTQLEKLIRTGKISAVLTGRPWLPGEPPLAGTRNWLLITTETIDEITAHYTALFTKK
ncbi:MAG: hypothetical protein RRC34_16245 [Lentisphaeria bacterium]|nr:hypothetical protein [Lentisphaeria bacterium]